MPPHKCYIVDEKLSMINSKQGNYDYRNTFCTTLPMHMDKIILIQKTETILEEIDLYNIALHKDTFLRSSANPPILDLPVMEYAGTDFFPTVFGPISEGRV